MKVLLTGAARGIGRGLALAFARAGHDVAVSARRDSAEGRDLARELAGLGVRSQFLAADVADPARCRALVEDLDRSWGGLDGLVNNAGIARDRGLLKMSAEEWREVLDVNLSGSFYCLQAAARVMAPRRSGFILNVGSLLGFRGGVGCANYVAAKAGLVGLTRAAARELGRFNIRVNAVLPGFHLTGLSEHLPPAELDRVRKDHLLERTTDPAELARLVLALAESSTVSGQVFNVDSRLP